MIHEIAPGCCATPPPLPGSFGLSRIGGVLGKLIAAGQAFSGDGSRWTHAFIVLDDETVLEAMPGGARIVPLADRLNDSEVVFCDTPVAEYLQKYRERVDLESFTDEKLFMDYVETSIRGQIVARARALKGSHYGYLQYLALGLVSLGFKPWWLVNYIESKGSMICSQLVDEVYRRVGINLFDDHRLPQQVTPGDLAIRFGIA